jgi:UDP-N-acetylmuramoylalanine--D-glutamate ligase
MTLNTFSGRRIVILGLARQGVALARFFLREGAQVTISDVASADQLAAPLAELDGTMVRLVLGSHPIDLLDGCDLLCLSGGVPPQIPLVEAARRQGIPLSNDTILTIDQSPAPAIGITGSSGKTTTTTLVGLMLEKAVEGGEWRVEGGGWRVEGGEWRVEGEEWRMESGERPFRSFPSTLHPSPSTLHPSSSTLHPPQIWVGGNIGVPLVDKLEHIRPSDWLVLELSSFQLELFDDAAGGRSLSPHVAAILNITPNHLDRHPSMAHYAACKANIVRWQRTLCESSQRRDPIAVLGADDPIAGSWLRTQRVEIAAGSGQEARAFDLAGRLLGFGLGEPVGEGCWWIGGQLVLRLDGVERPVLAVDHIQLRGRHNIRNVAAACAIASAVGADPAAMAYVARSFTGVEHRLQLVRELNGIRWYNDSIATAPERAAAALHSFEEPIVLLAGGRDKKLPWDDFARLACERVRVLIMFGEAAELIERAVTREATGGLRLIRCTDLAEAVSAAAQHARPGDVVLLSPGGTSFDAYKDFAARGEHFSSLVWAL